MSEGTASKDPIQFVVKPLNNSAQSDSVHAGLSELAQMARQAFEEKRRKQSLALANAILKIDPEYKEAVVIQSWVRADLQKDISTARALVDEAAAKKSLPLYDRSEALARAILNIDAENEEAKGMLRDVMAAQNALAKSPPLDEEEVFSPPVPKPVPVSSGRGRKRRLVLVALVGVLAAGAVFGLGRFKKLDFLPASEAPKSDPVASEKAEPDNAPKGSLDFFVVPPVGVQLAIDDTAAQPVPQTLELTPGVHRLSFTAEGYTAQTLSEKVEVGKHRVIPVVMKTAKSVVLPPESSSDSAGKNSKTASNSRQTAASEKQQARTPAPAFGTLAVTSPIPVDVFVGGKLVGTTPLSIQLPLGVQTVEYRLDNLQKSASYAIRADQTTTATVAFDVNLQINARPWAQVSIDGPQGKTLGQTPLSNVSVPVGSVLIFQNPSFSERRIRVTGKETNITVVLN